MDVEELPLALLLDDDLGLQTLNTKGLAGLAAETLGVVLEDYSSDAKSVLPALQGGGNILCHDIHKFQFRMRKLVVDELLIWRGSLENIG